MKRNLTILGLVVCLLTITSFAQAEIINVPEDYPTIQQAIDVAQSGDLILIGAGTYSPSTNGEQFPIYIEDKQELYILGEYAPETILDATSSNPYVVISIYGDYDGSNSITIDGITIESINWGIRASHFKDLTIKRCRFLNFGSNGNTIEIRPDYRTTTSPVATIAYNYFSNKDESIYYTFHRAITLSRGSSLVKNNTITGFDIGINVDGELQNTLTIKNNLIYGNSNSVIIGDYGGDTDILIENNTISDGTHNGIVFESDTMINSAVIKNNVITNHNYGINTSPLDNLDNINISYNDVWGNASENYNGCEPGIGDISADPRFVDPANGDYHLSNLSGNYSLAIDKGDPYSDYSLEPMPNGGRINMGAYGNTREAETSRRILDDNAVRFEQNNDR